MKLSEAFPSKWLKADDMEDGDMILTITAVTLEKIKDSGGDTDKLVVAFKEADKKLICNKVNSKTIANIHGGDTDDWVGKKVALYATEVEYAGETMLGIRVRLKAPRAAGVTPGGRASGPVGMGSPARQPARQSVPSDDFAIPGEGGDDESPF